MIALFKIFWRKTFMKIVIENMEELSKRLKYFSQLKTDQLKEILLLTFEEANFLLNEKENSEYTFYFDDDSWIKPEKNGIYVKIGFRSDFIQGFKFRMDFIQGFMFRDFFCCSVKWIYLFDEKGKYDIGDYEIEFSNILTSKYNVLMKKWFGKDYIIDLLHARFPYEFSVDSLIGLKEETLNYIFNDRNDKMMNREKKTLDKRDNIFKNINGQSIEMKSFSNIETELYRKIDNFRNSDCFILYVSDEVENTNIIKFNFTLDEDSEKVLIIKTNCNKNEILLRVGKNSDFFENWPTLKEEIIKFISDYIPYDKFYYLC